MAARGPGAGQCGGRPGGTVLTRDDRGAATLLVVTFLALLLVLTGGLGVATAMVAAHRRAQAAADLAALAAAHALVQGQDACAAAAHTAAANGARLSSCVPADGAVLVEVRVAGPRWLGVDADLAGRARAGPAAPLVRPRVSQRRRSAADRSRPGPASGTAR